MKDLKVKPASLREKAESLIKRNTIIDEVANGEEVMKLLHELEVYQIELEMQNEELLSAKENAEFISQKYTALYDFAPMGYFTLNPVGLILEINHSGAKLLGKEKDVLIGSSFINYLSISSQKPFNEFLTKVFEGDSKLTCELKLLSAGSQEVYIYLEGIVLSPDYCLLAGFDVTERHMYENTLHANEARLQELNATKDKFFSIIAHDLRGPFTSIIGFTELLLEQIQNKKLDRIEYITGIVHHSSVQAMDLLSNLLEWARLQTGKIKFSPVCIDIKSVIERVISLLNSSVQHKSLSITNKLNREYRLHADPDMLSNVFRNIISNAIKFTPAGGSIIIEAEELPDALLVTISDTGVGISADNIQKLFRIDTVYSSKGTEKETGTGLGLLLCKEFIEKHGGKIWVESEQGNGSKFLFTIPFRHPIVQ